MKVKRAPTILSVLVSMTCIPLLVYAQNSAITPPPSQNATQYTPAQLDQMLAPVALYPDELVGPILTAATYPLEIVEADRWLQEGNNRTLKGDLLTAALAQEPWDASVKSLVPFPQILKMMDGNLQWTEEVGDAFLANQGAVMDSVQRLRHDAQLAGRLPSNTQETVSTNNQTIVVEPTSPDIVYLPCYNSVIYDPWPWPENSPIFFPDYVCAGPLIVFGIGYPFGPFWGWDHWDWHNHRLNIDVGKFNSINGRRPPLTSTVWQHNPVDRHGVPYRDAASRAKFQPNSRLAPDALRAMRGYTPRVSNPATLGEQSPPVPVFESPARGSDVRTQSIRGSISRGSLPPGSVGSSSPGPGGRIGGGPIGRGGGPISGGGPIGGGGGPIGGGSTNGGGARGPGGAADGRRQ